MQNSIKFQLNMWMVCIGYRRVMIWILSHRKLKLILTICIQKSFLLFCVKHCTENVSFQIYVCDTITTNENAFSHLMHNAKSHHAENTFEQVKLILERICTKRQQKTNLWAWVCFIFGVNDNKNQFLFIDFPVENGFECLRKLMNWLSFPGGNSVWNSFFSSFASSRI